jgi:hypothetical protein
MISASGLRRGISWSKRWSPMAHSPRPTLGICESAAEGALTTMTDLPKPRIDSWLELHLRFFLVQLEDLLGMVEQMNLP